MLFIAIIAKVTAIAGSGASVLLILDASYLHHHQREDDETVGHPAPNCAEIAIITMITIVERHWVRLLGVLFSFLATH